VTLKTTFDEKSTFPILHIVNIVVSFRGDLQTFTLIGFQTLSFLIWWKKTFAIGFINAIVFSSEQYVTTSMVCLVSIHYDRLVLQWHLNYMCHKF